jgi:hypothetical protein
MGKKAFFPAFVFALSAAGFFAPGCLPPKGRPGVEPPPAPAGVPAPSEPPLSEAPAGVLAVVFAVSPQEDPLTVAEFLRDRPHWRASLVLHGGFYADDEKAAQARAVVSALADSGRAEIVMTVSGEPVLALIQNTDLAKMSRPPLRFLPPPFAWPEDALGHLAQARGFYQRHWRRAPAAVVMPGSVVAGSEMPLLEKIGARWILLRAAEPGAAPPGREPGCYGDMPVVLVRPAVFSAARAAEWKERLRTDPAPPPLELRTLEDAKAFDAWAAASPAGLAATVSEVLAQRKDLTPWPDPDKAPPDFSPWIGEAQENLAWRLLGAARQAVEDYKNSGQASLRKLDSAVREIYTAESSRYFYYFGNDFDSGRDAELEREFLATLAQVYRLLDKPVPAAFLAGFSEAGADFSGPETGAEETSFDKVGAGFRWTDAAGDGRGPGGYEPPEGGEFSADAWDLKSFEVQPSAQDVSFRFRMASLANPWRAPYGFSLPLVEVYMDINHLPGAGSEALLSGRPGAVDGRDAWEYALSVDGWGARLYQHRSGALPRLAARLPVRVSPGSGIRVDVPRTHLRGDPAAWGYGVAVMGCHPPAPAEPSAACSPMAVEPQAASRQFGGAARSGAPPYLDILVPRGHEQRRVLGVYEEGREIVLPFLRGE